MQINDLDIFRDKSFVNGEWVEAKSGKRFDIYGKNHGVSQLADHIS